MSESNWVPLTFNDELPFNAVIAGIDSDGTTIHVGRAEHENEMLPAKILFDKMAAYVSYGGEELFKNQFEVLCENEDYSFKWEAGAHGSVSERAVSSGATADGEILFIGRASLENTMTPGKIHTTHGCLYVPYGGSEHRCEEYEVLVSERKFRWVPTSADSLPDGAVVAGQDADGTTMFVCRADHNGELVPGKHLPNKGEAYVSYQGKEHRKEFVEVLCNGNVAWEETAGGSIPANAVSAGRAEDGEVLFVGRAEHKGSLTVGKVHPSHGKLYIPFGGKEVSFKKYEILVTPW